MLRRASMRAGHAWKGGLAALITCVLSTATLGQITGGLDLSLVARRIPTTVDGEIKTDTPSEFTSMELAIRSELEVIFLTGFIDPQVKAAINTAGLEHFVFLGPLSLNSVEVLELPLKDVALLPEVWIAVPFESVVDVSNLSNSVVIPPGDPLFVSARVTLKASALGFDIEHLLMLEDVNYPQPGSSFDPLSYDLTNQDFAMGSLTSINWRANAGVSMQLKLGLAASSSAKAIKGHSGSGKVTPDSSFLRINVSGFSLGRASLLGIGAQDVAFGTSFSASTGTEEIIHSTISISGPAWEGTTLSMSISFGALPSSPSVSSILLSATTGPFKVGIALDTLEITGLSANCSGTLNLGAIGGSWGVNATGIDRGLTGLSFRLMLSQGTFSSSTSISFSQRGDGFGFASWGNTLTLRFSPAMLSVRVTFGRNGLTQASISTSVTF